MSSTVGERLQDFVRRNSHLVLFGVKASIGPGALTCLIECSAYLNHFQTISFLPAVIAACSLPTLARARLLWFHFQLTLAFTVTYAYCLLAGYSGLQARRHAGTNNAALNAYNGSAEAVVAVFFVFYFWIVFTLKLARPAWAVPCALAGLYTGAALPPQAAATTFEEVKSAGDLTIEAFLAGQAFSLAVGLLILPLSSRKAFLQNNRACLSHAISLSKIHVKLVDKVVAAGPGNESTDEERALVSQLKNALQAFQASASQAKSELNYAKQELAWSRLDSNALENLYNLTVSLTPLLSGTVSTASMLHTARERDFARSQTDYNPSSLSKWQDIRYAMHAQSKELADRVLVNATEALRTLDLIIGGSRKKERILGGDLEGSLKVADLSESKNERNEKGNESADRMDTNNSLEQDFLNGRSLLRELTAPEQHIKAVHYFMILGERQTLALTASEMQKLLSFLQTIDGSPPRLVFPNPNSITQYFWSLFALKGVSQAPQQKSGHRMTRVRGTGSSILAWLSHFSSSKHAGFGLRGAVAVFSIGILAFLPSTSAFFDKQRFVWAVYAILLSLNDNAGSSTQSLIFRAAGTLASMLASYLVWYIPDQKTAGILVLQWCWFAILGSLYAKYTAQAATFFVAVIASIVMVGGELQTRGLGKQAVLQAGQEVYKPYVLFPYRMAIVLLGIVVAFFWTIFPFPLTAHRELRHSISGSLFQLAKYSIAIQETTRRRFFQDDGKRCSEQSLLVARRMHASEFQKMNTAAQSLVKFLDWELRLGPVFLKETAAKILALSEELVNLMSLIENVSTSMSASDNAKSAPAIEYGEGRLLYAHLCPDGVASRLLAISSSLAGDRVLAPDMNNLELPDITYFLSAECPTNAVFIAAALIHAANWYMIEDITELTRLAVEVVGTLDFRARDDV